jgi:hypothetical protein
MRMTRGLKLAPKQENKEKDYSILSKEVGKRGSKRR